MCQRILENAKYHTENPEGKEKCIIATPEEMRSVEHLFNPKYRRFIPQVIEHMEYGIEFCFWYTEDGYLYCEG